MSKRVQIVRCQIVCSAKLFVFAGGAKLSWCQIVRGAKLSYNQEKYYE